MQTLVSIASSESEEHLLAMSKRESVTEPVTDVLVSVGNKEVVNSVAKPQERVFRISGF